MIIELTKDQLNILNNKLLSKETVKKELTYNPFAKYLILIEKENVIGYLYYSDIYDRVEINQIEIDFFHRKCGKASKLLEKLIESVEKDITLEVKEDNIAAINLYKKYQFKKKAIRKGYYQGIDGILMERKFRS